MENDLQCLSEPFSLLLSLIIAISCASTFHLITSEIQKMPKKVLSRTNSGTPGSITGSRKSNESFDTLDEEEAISLNESGSDEIDGDEAQVCCEITLI